MNAFSSFWRSALAGASVAVFGAVGIVPAAAQAIDLSGQTITLVYNSAPGGATALGAQIVADAWSNTMAGNPTIVAQAVEGGALSRGIHHVMNARPDGRTLGWLAWTGSTRVLDPAELQIPFNEFGLIGGVGGGHFFTYVSSSLGGGITDKDEFVEKVDSITFGGSTARSAAAMRMAAAFDLLGVPYSFVSGLGGDAPLQAALQRGEIQGYAATAVNYNRYLRDGPIKEGEAVGLFYFSPPNEDGQLVEDPSMPELEPFDRYYRRVKGEEPSGPIWEMIKFHGRLSDPVNWLVVAPPGTPEEHLTMLRESFAQAMETPEFIANSERIFGQRPVVTTFPAIEAIVEEVSHTAPEILDTMRGYLETMER